MVDYGARKGANDSFDTLTEIVKPFYVAQRKVMMQLPDLSDQHGKWYCMTRQGSTAAVWAKISRLHSITIFPDDRVEKPGYGILVGLRVIPIPQKLCASVCNFLKTLQTILIAASTDSNVESFQSRPS